jgi:hypothetical protein
MLDSEKSLITNKTKYFIIFVLNVLRKYVTGLKINHNQLHIYFDSINLIYMLTFVKYNSIINLKNLVDIAVVDNVHNKNRFEITYVF